MNQTFAANINFLSFAPALILAGFASLAIILALLGMGGRKIAMLSVVGLACSAVDAALMWGANETLFKANSTHAAMLIMDGYTAFFCILFSIGGIMAVILSIPYLAREGNDRAEYYILLLFSVLGAMLMAGTRNLVMAFVGLETMSICLYILAGYFRDDERSLEAALKYFIIGSFASGILLYGMALLYGMSGTTDIERMWANIASRGNSGSAMTMLGIALALAGLGFKIAAVPFHMWTPDVYTGAPTPVTAIMSTVIKGAALALVLRFFPIGGATPTAELTPVIWWLAALTMATGNLIAIAQTNIKRMLAYSSIAHAGYLLVGVLAFSPQGNMGVLIYMLPYLLANIGAFAFVAAFGSKGEADLSIASYAGVASRNPAAALAMAVFMFSLTGMPPTGGFIGKFYVFSAAVNAGQIGIVVIGVLMSAISAYFYLRVIVTMYMADEDGSARLNPSPAFTGLLAVCALGILLIGIFPGIFATLAHQASQLITFTGI
jgi:NADH-quinone oxidoreductase subunit N